MAGHKFRILICGAGGIGRAVGLLLREIGDMNPDIYFGDQSEKIAKSTAQWITTDSHRKGRVDFFAMPQSASNKKFDEYLQQADIVLDCLPGSEAPRIARLAKKHNLHYANLTEYVKETEEVMQIAAGEGKGFLLQNGLAPGFIDVLANGLFHQFCREYQVDKVDYVSMKVGALTQNAYPPTYYGFTWSPVGVATLYVKPAKVIRDFKTVTVASLTERSKIILNGIEFEDDLTSGGAADLPEALAGKTENLDYKTLRYPGHFRWIDGLLREIPHGEDVVRALQKKMELTIPMVEEDLVVIYASVLGRDQFERLRIMEKTYFIKPVRFAGKKLRAIQATTAAGLAEATRLLLTGKYRGCVSQSQVDFLDYLNGPYISAIYR